VEKLKMKTRNLFLVPALIAMLNLIPAGRVTAQTFTVLHSFTGGDGSSLAAGLITNSSGSTLYGTASGGAVFAVNTDGTGFTNLHSFTALGGYPYQTNSDGANPQGELVLSGNTLYGTAHSGGSFGDGTVFAVKTDGTGFMTLHSFNYLDGASPYAGLILSGDTLYGTVHRGSGAGAVQGNGDGAVFAIRTNGTGFTNLHSFTGGSDGGGPLGRLILSGNTLYGTAGYGGSSGVGTVFALNTNGTGFTTLHSFAAATHSCCAGLYCYCLINSEGAYPYAGLILSGNTLYGTANQGGSSGQGTVFSVNTDGTGFTNLHSFTVPSAPYPVYLGGSNSDGANPQEELVLSGNTLYGTAHFGGRFGYGTVFSVNTDGTGFTNLHSFTGTNGANPNGLILSGSTLYGTAGGTVFNLSFRPQLTITPSGTNVILSWPTNVAGFDYTGYTLESTTNLASPAVWSTNSPVPVVIAGQNTATNSITGAQQFYRLGQ
jgi:uncharacterized repeat protein (TIGR03803 family)